MRQATIVGWPSGSTAAIARALSRAGLVSTFLGWDQRARALSSQIETDVLILWPPAAAEHDFTAVGRVLETCSAAVDSAWQAMASKRYGRVVVTVPAPFLSGQPASSSEAAQAMALQGLMRALAARGGPLGITANVLAVAAEESGIEAPLYGRFARGAEIGHALGFLCAEEAGYITGSTVCVDGGLTMR